MDDLVMYGFAFILGLCMKHMIDSMCNPNNLYEGVNNANESGAKNVPATKKEPEPEPYRPLSTFEVIGTVVVKIIIFVFCIFLILWFLDKLNEGHPTPQPVHENPLMSGRDDNSPT
jgi:hypothetical protein